MVLKPNSNDVLFYSFRKQYDESLSAKEIEILEARGEGYNSSSQQSSEGTKGDSDTKSETDSYYHSAKNSSSKSEGDSQSVSWRKGLEVLEKRQKDRGITDASLALSEESFSRTLSSYHSQGGDTKESAQNLFDQIMSHPSEVMGISTSNSQGSETREDNESADEEEKEKSIQVMQHSARSASPMGQSFDMYAFNDIKTKITKKNASDTTYTTTEALRERFKDVLFVDTKNDEIPEAPAKEGQALKSPKEYVETENEKQLSISDASSTESSVAIDEAANKSKIWSKRRSKVARTMSLSKVLSKAKSGRKQPFSSVFKKRMSKRKQKSSTTGSVDGESSTPFHKGLKSKLNKKISEVSLTRSYKKIATDLNVSTRKSVGKLQIPHVNLSSFARKSIAPLNASFVRTASKCRSSASEAMSHLRRSSLEKYEDVGEVDYVIIEPGVAGDSARPKARTADIKVEDAKAEDNSFPRTTLDVREGPEIEYSKEESAEQELPQSPRRGALIFAENGDIETSVPVQTKSGFNTSAEADTASRSIQSGDDGGNNPPYAPLNIVKSNEEVKATTSAGCESSSKLDNVEERDEKSTQDERNSQVCFSSGIERILSGASKEALKELSAPEITIESKEKEALPTSDVGLVSSDHGCEKPTDNEETPPIRDVPIQEEEKKEVAYAESSDRASLGGSTTSAGVKKATHEFAMITPRIIERFNSHGRRSEDSTSRGNPEAEIEMFVDVYEDKLLAFRDGSNPTEQVREESQAEGFPPRLMEEAAASEHDQALMRMSSSSKMSSNGGEIITVETGSGPTTGLDTLDVSQTKSSQGGSPVQSRKKLIEHSPNIIPVQASPEPSSKSNVEEIELYDITTKPSRGKRRSRNANASYVTLKPELATIRTTASDNGIKPKKSPRSPKAFQQEYSIRPTSPKSQATMEKDKKLKGRVSSSVVATNDDANVEMIANAYNAQEAAMNPAQQIDVEPGEGGSTVDELDKGKFKIKMTKKKKKKKNSIKMKPISFLKAPKKESAGRDDSEGADTPSSGVAPRYEMFPTESQAESQTGTQHIEEQPSLADTLPSEAHFSVIEQYSMMSSVLLETLPGMGDTKYDVHDISRLLSDFFTAAVKGDPDAAFHGCTNSLDSDDYLSLAAASTKSSFMSSPKKTGKKPKSSSCILDDVADVDESYGGDDCTAFSSPALLNQILAFNNCSAAGCNDGFASPVPSDVSSVSDSSTGECSSEESQNHDPHVSSDVVVEKKKVSPNSSKAHAPVEVATKLTSRWIEIPEPQKPAEEDVHETEPSPISIREKKKSKNGVKKRLLRLVKRNRKAKDQLVSKKKEDEEECAITEPQVEPERISNEKSFISLLSEHGVSSSSSQTSWIHGSDVFSGVASNGASNGGSLK